ncbi:AAA family ATPase [Psychrosphaera aquimarina]|uniref:AAA family ATPase n=1 Tax=Psychrosphaera aquimarina TaxID=2044854 RepID=A0ABU3R2V3_9GAMM|nr:AAA family ATPase [Psychrosphaera aquimarina]MDU0114013.1 AAA family ATPase [Psychrosphaera aquimarina]
MIIKRISVTGKGKLKAELCFEKGLNVVAGASDTGKSYVIKCFQYIFGGEDPPKDIDEAKGYNTVETEIQVDEKESFILRREISATKPKVTLIKLELDGAESETIVLNPSHKGKNNLSTHILNKLGLNDKVLVKGVQSLNTSSLTLRVLSKLFLVDEGRIITESSPLGEGQREYTQETSLLKTMLTGADDSVVKELKQQQDTEGAVESRVKALEEYVAKKFSNHEEVKVTTEKLDVELNGLEESLFKAQDELTALIEANSELDSQRNNFRGELSKLREAEKENLLLQGRFTLLIDKYNSDLERLEAGSEAASFVGLYELANCPTCDQEFQKEKDVKDLKQLIQSTEAEISKNKFRVKGLKDSIDDLKEEYKLLEEDITQKEAAVKELSEIIDDNISSKFKDYKVAIRLLNNKKNEFSKQRAIVDSRENLLKEIGELRVQLEDRTEKYIIPDFSAELDVLCKNISSILQRWAFPGYESVSFDIKSRDLVIGGKPRSHFGKGYRAISYAAFSLGLMEYLSKFERHPKFVILDSPLTTYKAGDNDENDDEVQLQKDMIFAFYIDLCDSFNDKQIIVFENQEPDEYLKPKMTYYHFSKNKEIGRYGFFPVT